MYGVSKCLHSASLFYPYVFVSDAPSNPTAIRFVSLSGERVWYIGRVGCPDGGNDVIDERSFLAKPIMRTQAVGIRSPRLSEGASLDQSKPLHCAIKTRIKTSSVCQILGCQRATAFISARVNRELSWLGAADSQGFDRMVSSRISHPYTFHTVPGDSVTVPVLCLRTSAGCTNSQETSLDTSQLYGNPQSCPKRFCVSPEVWSTLWNQRHRERCQSQTTSTHFAKAYSAAPAGASQDMHVRLIKFRSSGAGHATQAQHGSLNSAAQGSTRKRSSSQL